IESRVVHQGWCVAHLVDEVGIVNLVGGVLRARFHVVLQPERVADLMRNYVLQQAAHHLIRHRQGFCTRVKRRNLYEIPVSDKVHYVVKDLNTSLEDFTSLWI